MYEKGHILPGGWEIDGTLGEGSYGVVYRAKRAVVNKTEWAAIKHIPVPASAAELNAIYAELGTRDVHEVNEYLSTIKDALVSEYHQMREFQGHTNIVACNDISIIDREDSPGYDIFIRMELLTSLSNQIMDGKMDRKQTIRLGLDVCRALMLLSSKGIVHRDIKPQNIFVNENGDYKLGDFGTARSIQGTSTMMSMKGTYAYMAPEIMMNKPANFTTDIYSLGLVMYRLMNGNRAPFMQPGQASTATSIDAANTRRFRGEELPLPAEADEAFGKIICKACAFESWNRWQSADELYNALCDMAEGTIRRDPPLEPNPEEEKARADAEREKAKREQEKKEKEEKEQARLKQEKKKKGIKSLAIMIACAVTVVAGVIGIQEISRSSAYEEAIQAMSSGRLEEAKEGFAKLGDYRDATEKAEYITQEQERQQKYEEAANLMQQEDYLGAITIYAELGDYKDSKAKLKQAEGGVTENERKAQYSQAESLESEGKYEEAMVIYAALGEYSNAGYKYADLAKKIENYKDAQLRETMEEYETAEDYYAAAGKYKDAEAKAKEMKNWQLYAEAERQEAARNYEKAAEIYKKLSEEKFQDAETRQSVAEANVVKEIQYQAAIKLQADKRWDAAIDAFKELNGYHDSDEQIKKSYYEKGTEEFAAGKLQEALVSLGLAGNYEDTAQKTEEVKEQITENERKTQYSQAEKLEAEGKYEEAIAIYAALGEYSNAGYKCADLAKKIENYKEAQLRETMEEYETAEDYYAAAGKYKDAEAKTKETKNWQLYVEAQEHMDNGEYQKATALYERLSKVNFSDADKKLMSAQSIALSAQHYQQAENLLHQGKLEEALQAFGEAGEYLDAKEQYQSICYSLAQESLRDGKRREAFYQFLRAGDYSDALIQARKIGDGILCSDGGVGIVAALDDNGTIQEEHRSDGYINWDDWEKIELFARTDSYYIGIDTNEKVHFAANPWTQVYGEFDFLQKDIMSIDGRYHLVGVKKDGTAFAIDSDGSNTFKELNVDTWFDIVSIKAGNGLSFGLKKDGTVLLATNIRDRDYNDLSQWRNIKAIAADTLLVGINADGRVVVSGDSKPNVSAWHDIVAVETCNSYVVGLKSDGTVVGANTIGEIDELKEWRDIVAIDTNYEFIVGLKNDGSFVVHLLPATTSPYQKMLDNLKERNVLSPVPVTIPLEQKHIRGLNAPIQDYDKRATHLINCLKTWTEETAPKSLEEFPLLPDYLSIQKCFSGAFSCFTTNGTQVVWDTTIDDIVEKTLSMKFQYCAVDGWGGEYTRLNKEVAESVPFQLPKKVDSLRMMCILDAPYSNPRTSVIYCPLYTEGATTNRYQIQIEGSTPDYSIFWQIKPSEMTISIYKMSSGEYVAFFRYDTTTQKLLTVNIYPHNM